LLSFVTSMRSDKGPHRASNQDSAGCSDDYVFVADGVGGHAGGDVASWTITHRLMSSLASLDTRAVDVDRIREAIAVANAEIGLRAEREPALDGMSTTFTGLFCAEDAVRIAHIGDSRAYLVRDGAGRRMTRDDSYVQLLVDAGQVDEEDAFSHPLRNVILRSLGGSLDDPAGLTLLSVPARPGDRWLVASDGLTDYLPEEEVLTILAAAQDTEAAAEALLQATLAADPGDNVTLAVSDVVEVAELPRPRPYLFVGAAAEVDPGTIGDLSR
jgi:PPM family protein phosphatase